jgi:hypothetical protein
MGIIFVTSEVQMSKLKCQIKHITRVWSATPPTSRQAQVMILEFEIHLAFGF